MAVKEIKPRAKKKLEEEVITPPQIYPSKIWGDLFALSLLSFSLLGFFALLADFGSSGDGHILGPYLGNWLSLNLRRAFGKLPVFLALSWLLLLSLRFLSIEKVWNSTRNLFLYALLTLELLVLLSVKMLNLPFYSLDDFENTGGVVGNFLVHFILEPIVQQKVVGAYLILSFCIMVTLIWGLRLRPKDLIEFIISLKPNTPQGVAPSPSSQPHFEDSYEAPRGSKKPVPPKEKSQRLSDMDFIQQNSLDPELLKNPRLLRQLRDQMEDLERDRRLNEWEDRYQESAPEIEGNIRTPAPIPTPAPQISTPIPIVHTENTGPKTRITPKVDLKPEPRFQMMEHYDQYVIPGVDLTFAMPPEQVNDLTPDQLRQQAAHLEAQLANFDVKGKVINITTGPVITRFEIDLAPGVKLSKVANLGDDLALAIRAKTVRVLAPIPGKAAVGIEIPNPKSHIVYCRDILIADEFHGNSDQIIIGLGKDISGKPYVMDLATAPHMLIAGQTGSGKSVCINMLMASLLCSKSPDDLRMLLVDPKVVELKPYEHIPHLLAPVITNPEIAVQALTWACYEMDRRYEVLAKARVRNIAGYNKKFMDNQLVDLVEPEDNKRMPYLVIIVDEFADLMMVAGKQVEVAIARIAQKARAVGIHLVLATQRPSTNVITGVIKANLPTRIAFKVASHIDARTIMDKAGSEKLLGKGDMLFRSVNDPEPVRVHGAFLNDHEVELLAAACSKQNVNYPQLASFDLPGSGDGSLDQDMGPRDEKFEEAARMVVAIGQASTSMLQRRMQLGYARAGRIMDQLEMCGVVGKDRGAKGREILLSEEELESFLSGSLSSIQDY